MNLVYPDPELRSDTVRIREWDYHDLECIRAAGTDPNIPKGTTVPARFTEEEGRAFIERAWSRTDDGQALASPGTPGFVENPHPRYSAPSVRPMRAG